MRFDHYPPVMDVPAVADMLGCSIEEVRRLCGEGWLPGAKIDGRWLFHRDEVLDWFRSQRVRPPGDTEPDGDEPGAPTPS